MLLPEMCCLRRQGLSYRGMSMRERVMAVGDSTAETHACAACLAFPRQPQHALLGADRPACIARLAAILQMVAVDLHIRG